MASGGNRTANRGKGPAPDVARDAAIWQLRQEGHSCAEVAERFRIKPAGVRGATLRHKKRAGLPIRVYATAQHLRGR